LQTGTGLGLAIVNGIVQSESVGGKVDVWSEEGAGTEIKVTFLAEKIQDADFAAEMKPLHFDLTSSRTITLLGFDATHRGVQLLERVIRTYLVTWWGFEIHRGPEYGDIVIVNDDPGPLVAATERRDISRPFIILSPARGNPTLLSIAAQYESIGGFCRILYKPGGPLRLRSTLKLCLHALKIGQRVRIPSAGFPNDNSPNPRSPILDNDDYSMPNSLVHRRHSEEQLFRSRPLVTLRSTSTNFGARSLPTNVENDESLTGLPTVTTGAEDMLLHSPVRDIRVLVVEDNNVVRNLLMKWLSSKGYHYRDAVDGRDGVNVYEAEGPFDVVLLDLSMPVLDGIGATLEIRRIESARLQTNAATRATRILALTGMSSLEDKRRAFEAGVDGYLVKPVSFKTLDEMFGKLGIGIP